MSMRRRDRQLGPPLSFFSFQDIITCVTGILVLITLMLALDLATRKQLAEVKAAPDLQAQRGRLGHARRERDALIAEVESRTASINAASRLNPAAVEDAIKRLAAQIPIFRAGIVGLAEDNAAARRKKDEIDKQADLLAQAREDWKAKLQEAIRKPPPPAAARRIRFLPGNAEKMAIIVECRAEGLHFGTVAADGGVEPLRFIAVNQLARELGRFASTRNRQTEYFVFYVRPDAVEVFDTAHRLLSDFDVGWDALPSEQELFRE